MSYGFARIAAAGNLPVSTGRAKLHTVTINTKAASATVTVYNNVSAVSADIVAIIDAASTPVTLIYDVECPKGIFVVLASGNADVTVSYA